MIISGRLTVGLLLTALLVVYVVVAKPRPNYRPYKTYHGIGQKYGQQPSRGYTKYQTGPKYSRGRVWYHQYKGNRGYGERPGYYKPPTGYLKHKTSSYKLARYQRPYTQVPPLPVKFTKYYDSYDYQNNKALTSDGGEWTSTESKPTTTTSLALCAPEPICTDPLSPYRTNDGSCNNLQTPSFGARGFPYVRWAPPKHFFSSCGKCPKCGLPTPRQASQSLVKRGDFDIMTGVSQWTMVIGQVLDHDMEITPIREEADLGNNEFTDCCKPENENKPECCPIKASTDDHFYGKDGRPKCLSFIRSKLTRQSQSTCDDPKSKKVFQNPDVINENSAFVDAGFLYGSDKETANNLRTFSGGMMKTTKDNRERDFPVLEEEEDGLFMKFGDSRGDVHPAFTAVVTVFLRNHNRMAGILQQRNPDWADEKLYQETRKINIALWQNIVYTQFMDVLLGSPNDVAVTRLQGYSDFYNPSLDASISMPFATAGYRLHTFCPSYFVLRNSSYEISKKLQLREVFHRPLTLMQDDNMDDILRGLSSQPLQEFNNVFTEEMTEWLFPEEEENFGSDIVALNVQRGRDHMLQGYPTYRKMCKLGEIKSWQDVTDLIPPRHVHRLIHAYRKPEDIDAYIALNMEDPLQGSILGPTAHCIIRDQFRRLRDGDRFFFTNPGVFTTSQLDTIRSQTFSRLLCDNADDPSSLMLPRNVFATVNNFNNPVVSCANFPELNLSAW